MSELALCSSREAMHETGKAEMTKKGLGNEKKQLSLH